MVKFTYLLLSVMLLPALTVPSRAGCPLDHFLIGCNPDGVWGTEDDNRLFVDCTQKYRHSDPEHAGDPTWRYWHYPMYYSDRFQRYQIGEPGFDVFTDSDPNHVLEGIPNVDYCIIIECVSISPPLTGRNDYGVVLDESGDAFNHSELPDAHVHLQYRVSAGDGGYDPNELYWITYRLHDEIADSDQYEPSDMISVVFFRGPPAGDLVIDGRIDFLDLMRFVEVWLYGGGSRANDYYERADVNRDGWVDLRDLAGIAESWRTTEYDP